MLFSFIKKRDKQLVGVDIGTSSIKLVKLREKNEEMFLENFRVWPIENDALVEGAIINPQALVRSILEIFELENIRATKVCSSISGNSVILKKINVPKMSHDDLMDMLQWEAEQYIPYDLNEVYFDAHILEDIADEQDKMNVLLIAAKKSTVEDYETIFKQARLELCVLDTDVLSVANMLKFNYPDIANQIVLLVNVGARLSNIHVMSHGVSAFTRDIMIGGAAYTEEIQKQLNVSFVEAEDLKIGGKLSLDIPTSELALDTGQAKKNVGNILSVVSEQIAVEVKRSIDFYKSQQSSPKEISHIFLTGGGAKSPNLMQTIHAKTGIATSLAQTLKNIQVETDKFNLEQIESISHIAGVAVGLALRKKPSK